MRKQREMSDREWLIRRRLSRIFHFLLIVLGIILYYKIWRNPYLMYPLIRIAFIFVLIYYPIQWLLLIYDKWKRRKRR